MKNCWEKNKCGREPGGAKEKKLGTCPVATYVLADGFFGGQNGGRACIFIVGSLAPQDREGRCAAQVNGSTPDCFRCSFFNSLRKKYKNSFNLEVFNKYIENSRTLNLD
ncbi:MAG: hypothetical protein HQM02_00850 [Magnetococcales bacterium]|nr:hypothetical protein [Magnetococcales bacterium]